MEENKEMLQLLQKMNENSRRQTIWTMILCALLAVTAVCCLVIFANVGKLVPQLDTAIAQMQTVLTDVETVTGELAEADLEGMVGNVDDLVTDVDGLLGNVDGLIGNVDTLVTTGQDSLEQTMEKLNAIDFETLNKAIKDLSDVIEPIAKFFNLF